MSNNLRRFQLLKRYPLTQERLKEIVTYDEDTGHFRAKCIRGVMPGTRLMQSTTNTRISIDGRKHIPGHLVFLYLYGYNPMTVKYLDGDMFNTRESNLVPSGKVTWPLDEIKLIERELDCSHDNQVNHNKNNKMLQGEK